MASFWKRVFGACSKEVILRGGILGHFRPKMLSWDGAFERRYFSQFWGFGPSF